ncbi:MAG: hypothetical protein WDN49_18050 [Acetobacteraceae bacterium]
MAFPHDAHRALIADFVDAIGNGREPQVNGRGALGVHRLIDALLLSPGKDGAFHHDGHAAHTALRRDRARPSPYLRAGRPPAGTRCECAGFWTDGEPQPLAGFRKRFPDIPRVADQARLLEDPSIALILTAAIPSDRAAIAIAAMRHGKDVMTDKPGCTTLAQNCAGSSPKPGGYGRSVIPSASRSAPSPALPSWSAPARSAPWCRRSAWGRTG